MKRQKAATAVLAIGSVFLLGLILVRNDAPLTEQAATAAIKQKYSTLRDYPSDKLPPRSISTVQSDGMWYVAFIQHGSGQPVLEARCFIVKPDYSIIENGTFAPGLNSKGQHVSPMTCR